MFAVTEINSREKNGITVLYIAVKKKSIGFVQAPVVFGCEFFLISFEMSSNLRFFHKQVT